jgi:hypothetical protein
MLASENHTHAFNCNPSFNVCRVSVLDAAFDCPPFTQQLPFGCNAALFVAIEAFDIRASFLLLLDGTRG